MDKRKSPGNIAFRGLQKKGSGDDLLSHPAQADSTIGAVGLNFRVRKGIGCFPYAMVTGKVMENKSCTRRVWIKAKKIVQVSRLISTTRLNPLPDLHLWPINPVVYREPSVPPEGGKGNLILGGASCLYAFSAYPCRT